jgi:hypothetical protein
MSGAVVLASVSDIHAGGSTAVCPDRIRLDDGGWFESSKAQKWLWQSWLDYWKQVDETRKREKAKLFIVLNGDLVEGQHHHSTQVLTGNPNGQKAVVNACFAVPLALKPDRIIIVRGTEAHVGASAAAEETIADGLRRDKRPVIGDPDTGTASWWHFRGLIGGKLVDITHHGRTGLREHTRAAAASYHAHDILLSYVKSGERPPDLCIRGHFHKFNDSHDACQVRVITTGAWQLGTSYVHKVAADSLTDIGGLIVVIKDGDYTAEKVQFQPSRGAVWHG